MISNVVYFAALAALSAFLSQPLWFHAGIAYLLSTIVNYSLHYRVTFRSTAGHGAAVARYIPVQLVGLTLNSAILYALVTELGLHYLLGQVVAIVATTTWSYLANRNWVFASNHRET